MGKHGGSWFVVLALAGCNLARDGLGLSRQESPAAVPEPDSEVEEPAPEPPEPPVVPPMPPPMEVDASVVEAPEASNACELTGSFALRIDAEVSWSAPFVGGFASLVLPGSGALVLHARVDAEPGSATLAACGAVIPEVAVITGEKLGGDFPDAVWDSIQERWSTALTFDCDQPGCKLRTGTVEPALGLALKPGAAWPGPLDIIDVGALRDEDGDNVPGVPFALRVPVSLGLFPVDRLASLSMALRVGTALEGVLDSCDEASGTTSALSFDARVLACQLQGFACRNEQVGLLARVFPTWQVQRASWRLVRLSPGDSCADVRAALP